MKKLTIVLILAILIAGCQRVPEESCMAVEFSGNNYVEFSGASAVENMTVKSVSFWMNLDTIPVRNNYVIYKTGAGWYIAIDPTPYLFYVQAFSGDDRLAYVRNLTLTGGWHHIVMTYNSTDLSNDPIFYYDSIAQLLDIDSDPTGIMEDDSDGSFFIGGTGSLDGIDGKIQDVRIYNRILTQTEINTLYNSRCQRVVMNGLVFWAPLVGASGTQTFGTLSNENRVLDVIGGVQGIPYGNPIGRASTIQTIGGQ